MQKSNESVKSRGIVAFAQNTETTDYMAIASRTLKLASQTLGIPYTIISTESDYDNNRYDIDSGSFVKWRNTGRHSVYDLSPYDETICIDADYLVLDDNLNKVFDTEFDYLLTRDCMGITQDFPRFMGPNSLPYVWATVFAFRKTPRAKLFFSLISRIEKNYSYYRTLFNVEARNFRNDYAFAMADVLLNGFHIDTESIPGRLINVDQSLTAMESRGDLIVLRDSNTAYVVPKTNLHIMSKAFLQSDRFQEFLTNVTT
jgi:hypothetical protein